jgi:hypothetical protein
MNLRRARPFRNGTSLAVILPADWVRGNKVEPGDELELAYDEVVRIKLVKTKKPAIAAGAGARANGRASTSGPRLRTSPSRRKLRPWSGTPTHWAL